MQPPQSVVQPSGGVGVGDGDGVGGTTGGGDGDGGGWTLLPIVMSAQFLQARKGRGRSDGTTVRSTVQ